MNAANIIPQVAPSPEYVRRNPQTRQLELVRIIDGIEWSRPVQITSQIIKNRIVVGLEAAPIVWNVNGQSRLIEVA